MGSEVELEQLREAIGKHKVAFFRKMVHYIITCVEQSLGKPGAQLVAQNEYEMEMINVILRYCGVDIFRRDWGRISPNGLIDSSSVYYGCWVPIVAFDVEELKAMLNSS